jgi:exodeoxyribonuclease-5
LIRAVGCDEASMVGDSIGRDLESLHIPLILMYDPFQLPPVKAKFAWQDTQPDVFLTQIMRTGEGSGVAFAAGDIRLGRSLQNYGEDFKILPKGKLTFQNYADDFDMIIVGTNALRRRMNDGIRKYKNLPNYPVVGDQIMSLNNQDCGISNGEVFRIEKINNITPRIINFDLVDLFGNSFRHVKSWRPVFDDDSSGFMAPFGFGQFTYGYCLTAHKAQGSEAKRVCVLDSWNGGEYQRWLYTAVTRASESCVLVR